MRIDGHVQALFGIDEFAARLAIRTLPLFSIIAQTTVTALIEVLLQDVDP
jgi:hypothetical protein